MATMEQMTVALPATLTHRIHAAVETGEYASANDAVEDAVRLWSDRRDLAETDIEHLRQDWDAGMSSGTHGPLDFDDLRRELRSRLEAGKAACVGSRDAG